VTSADVVIVGSGINGLVAGALLARAGLAVTVLEAADTPGGAMASAELTLPGYRHDVMASWLGTFVNGPAWPLLCDDLEPRGLRIQAAEGWVTATAGCDGRVVKLHRDPARSVEAWARADARAYRSDLARIRRLAPRLQALQARPDLRGRGAARDLLGLVRAVGLRGIAPTVRDAVSSGQAWTARNYLGDEVDRLAAPWLLHAGLAPDAAGGGVIGPMLLSGLHRAGMPVAIGGIGRLVDALCAVITDHGGEIVTGAAVDRILVEGGRASGACAADHVYPAARAVLASVPVDVLYDRLLAEARERPTGLSEQARRVRTGRSAMQIHLALTAPLQWNDPALNEVPLVHLADGSAAVALSCAEAATGLLPRAPVVAVGQHTVLDATRAPAGAATLWLQLPAVPEIPHGDAAHANEAAVPGWHPDTLDLFVDRVIDRIAVHAPDIRTRIAANSVLTPVDLEARNRNLRHGDPYGGATELDQTAVWRPFPGAARLQRAIPGLWHIGASSHGGPGLGATSGVAAAQALLRGSRRAGGGARVPYA
jgi:phytoene dehydrogenase-like protein